MRQAVQGVFRDAFGLVYAGIWAWPGAAAAHVPVWPALGVIAVVDLVLLAAFLRRDLILKRPEITYDPRLSRATRIGRIIAIAIAVNLARIEHRPDLLLPLVGVIIGVSYLPLARALREPVHQWVGVLVIGITIGSLALPHHVAIAGLGTALAVWGGCAARLWRAERMETPFAGVPTPGTVTGESAP